MKIALLIAIAVVVSVMTVEPVSAGCCTIPCMWYEIQVAGECVPCEGGTIPNEDATACVSFPVDPCIDVSDVDSGSVQETHDYYWADPTSYWLTTALPNLGRLAAQRVSVEESNPLGAYDALMGSFSSSSWSSAVATGAIAGSSAGAFYSQAHTENPSASDDWKLRRTLSLISDHVESLGLSGSSAESTNAALYGPLFGYGFDGASVDASLGPVEVEICNNGSTSIPQVNTSTSPCDNEMCTGDYCPAFPPAVTPKPDDSERTRKYEWLKINGASFCNTTYNPACQGPALGGCLAKLGAPGFGKEFTCEQWNELGRLTHPKNPGGKYFTEMMSDKGYAYHVAKDSDGKTACENAAAALGRGCDVLIHWPGTKDVSGHIEYVHTITTAADKKNCNLKTTSWGQEATVDYKDGKLSGKSDKARYPAGNNISVAQEDYLGRIEIFCKK